MNKKDSLCMCIYLCCEGMIKLNMKRIINIFSCLFIYIITQVFLNINSSDPFDLTTGDKINEPATHILLDALLLDRPPPPISRSII